MNDQKLLSLEMEAQLFCIHNWVDWTKEQNNSLKSIYQSISYRKEKK